MAHRWHDFRPYRMSSRHHRCLVCGLVQQHSSAERRIGGATGGWYPPVGKCGKVNLKLRRVESGRYTTSDGRFEVWQSPAFERHWYVNLSTEDDDAETLYLGGFRTKYDAVHWLSMNALDYLE